MSWAKIKNQLSIWKRVPPGLAFRYIPRVLGYFSQKKAVDELNRRFPPRQHRHITPINERFAEIGPAERVVEKWRAKPYEMSWKAQSDEPVPKNYYTRLRDEEQILGFMPRFEGDGPDNLPDYEFPIPPGRMVLQWLYEIGKEPARIQRSYIRFSDFEPYCGQESWIAPSAVLIGNVLMSTGTSVFDHCVLKADKSAIIMYPRSHVMEGTTISTAHSDNVTNVGDVQLGICTLVGTNCNLHACKIGGYVLIGDGCTIRYGAVICDECIIGAGSVVEENQYIPSGEVWAGCPARYIRKMGDIDIHTRVAESNYTHDLKLEYSFQETVHGNVTYEMDQVIKGLEQTLEEHLGGDIFEMMKKHNYDPEALNLPPSLVDYLLKCVTPEDHPNPSPTLTELARKAFVGDFEYNRSQEQRPVYTGGYSKPNMSKQMY